MGMYDTLYVNVDKLPVSPEEKVLIGKNRSWQTKDLYCTLTEIYITDEGTLTAMKWRYEEVPKEERAYPEADGLLGLIGSMRRVDEHLETVPHHGYVSFYSDVGDDWYEFSAKFTDGKLVSIEGGKQT